MDSAQAYEKCLKRLIWASKSLKLEIQPHQLAEIADLIVQPMTGPWRYFHTPQHIFDVGGTKEPIEVLAALFHDLVYLQADLSINFNLSYFISPFIKEIDGRLTIRQQGHLPPDKIFAMVAAIFGFVPGQILNPYVGQNEFLSALVAAKVLEPFVLPQQMLQIIACIEATIPFRPKTEDGLTTCDRLYKRLHNTNIEFNLGLNDGEIIETVKASVRMANRDVSSFAHPQAAQFLANTWNLLPETNHKLSTMGAYTVGDYRTAIQAIEAFMSSLEPNLIFHQFRGEPDNSSYELLYHRASRNLEIAQLYLKCKLVTIALIEALSLTIGVDIPLTIMMGEIPLPGFTFMPLEYFLPEVSNPYSPKTNIEKEVFDLLTIGRAKSIHSDLQHSPVATFIVKSIGFEAMTQQCDRAKQFFQDKISTEDFLDSFNPTLLENIIGALLELFESRKTAISHCYGITLLKSTNFQVKLS
ncbi:hypothetical protein [Brunnivagina elsteri]|uniref:Uncharacterized protein n=1 Tax=Brunnivagina elsteri CCALA 953 TaxID=987040 RepID=A0A2A2TCD8_9CYAN|nr:hypothetical protein [Calothrix elsteri]PAX51467.1 hypothetical protein CK510_24635 [Calothrix elsteri CCALA 953]